jgi:prepilin-type N-terminal cleavage/methylation domain-containing protein
MRSTRTSTQPRARGADGFTLVEICWAMAIFGILAAVSVGGLRGWTQAREHSGTAVAVQSLLREAQQRAVTEGRAICVNFDVAAQVYDMYRGSCDDPTRVLLQSRRPDSGHVRLTSPAFVGPAGSTAGVTFKPRGTAWPGSVQITREGAGKVYTVSVEGLTGRVSRA